MNCVLCKCWCYFSKFTMATECDYMHMLESISEAEVIQSFNTIVFPLLAQLPSFLFVLMLDNSNDDSYVNFALILAQILSILLLVLIICLSLVFNNSLPIKYPNRVPDRFRSCCGFVATFYVFCAIPAFVVLYALLLCSKLSLWIPTIYCLSSAIPVGFFLGRDNDKLFLLVSQFFVTKNRQ